MKISRAIDLLLLTLAARGLVLVVLDAMTVILIVWLFRQAATLVW